LISRRALLSQLGLLAAVGGGAWWLRAHVLWPSPSPVFADGRSSGWLDFTSPEGGVPMIMVLVGGAPVRALVDSGAQSSVIDRGLAQKLGLPTTTLAPVIVAFGLSGAPQLGRTARLDVGLGGLILKDLHAAVFDLAAVADASGRDFGLILGQDVLKQVVADLDFPAARLAFHNPRAYVPPEKARATPVRRSGGQLFAPVTVETTQFEAVIDTGASAVLALSAETARTAGLLSGRRIGTAPSVTFGGLSQDQVVLVDAVAFAGETYRNVPVHIYAPDRNIPLPSGLIGVEAFERFRTILDVGRGRLHLVPAGPEVSPRGPVVRLSPLRALR
jgi:predicted aspartyl protease